jgi:hypothetical protein
MRFGEMTLVDCDVMEGCLKVMATDRLKFLEIGTYRGGTARAVKEWCMGRNVDLEYWGVDNGALGSAESPFYEANFIKGDSIEVFNQIPDDFDLVFIDGDHGGNHVVLETLIYGKKVRPGGIMLFHDTAPHVQQTMREAVGPDHPWFYNSVIAAHQLMGFPSVGWKLFRTDYDPSSRIGGMTAYLKAG